MAVMMDGVAVSCYSQNQEVVGKSTSEAEYVSLCSNVIKVVWIRRIVTDIGLVQNVDTETVVNGDN